MKRLFSFLSIALLSLGLAVCSQNNESSTEVTTTVVLNTESLEATEGSEAGFDNAGTAVPYTVVDNTGREITFDAVPQKAVAMGHGGLKLYSYICGTENLIGIEETETKGHTITAQSIHYAYPTLRDISIIGNGGSKFEPDYEKLSFSEADVIIVSYGLSKEELDEMQNTLNIPVVGVRAGMHGQIFGDDIIETFSIIGKVMNREDRAKQLIDYMDSLKKELTSRTMIMSDSPEFYIGGCSYRGEQGILSTKTKIDLLSLVNVRNIMSNESEEQSIIIDKEKLLDLNPDNIILDLSGKSLILEDMQADRNFYESLSAFSNNKVYAILPYFTYGMNYDTAIIDMYYIGKVAHPDKFADVDMEKKAAEIYEMFVGKNVYNDLMGVYPEAMKEFKLSE